MPEKDDMEVIKRNIHHIQTLARVDSIIVDSHVTKPDASATSVFGRNQVHVLLKGLLDFNDERKRLKKAIEKIEKAMDGSRKKLSNENFPPK